MRDLRTVEITQMLAWAEIPSVNDIAVADPLLCGALASIRAIINQDVIDAAAIASGTGSTFHSPLVLDVGGCEHYRLATRLTP